jgi:hypothetical protein
MKFIADEQKRIAARITESILSELGDKQIKIHTALMALIATLDVFCDTYGIDKDSVVNCFYNHSEEEGNTE